MQINVLNSIVIDSDVSLHQDYRDFYDMYLEYALKGVYASVNEALSDFENTLPDIVFSEVSLPDNNGIESIPLFRKMNPEVKVIMLSLDNDYELVKKAFKNGANGFLSKPVSERTLYNALDSVKWSGATMSNDIVSTIVSSFQRKSLAIFSERENQVIDYLCQGDTYKTIAEKLFVTVSAINFHVQNIYLKLNVNSKSEALQKLRELEFSRSVA